MGACPISKPSVAAEEAQNTQEQQPVYDNLQPVASNLFFEQDMTANLELDRTKPVAIERIGLNEVYNQDLAIAHVDSIYDENSEQIIIAELDHEEIVCDDDGNVLDIIYHFKKTTDEVKREQIAKIEHRRRIIERASRTARRKLPAPQHAENVSQMRRESFEVCIVNFAPNSKLLYVILNNDKMRKIISTQTAEIFVQLTKILRYDAVSDAFVIDSDPQQCVARILEQMMQSGSRIQVSAPEMPYFATKQALYQQFYLYVNATLIHYHFSVICINEQVCNRCAQRWYAFERVTLIYLNNPLNTFIETLDAFFAQTLLVKCYICHYDIQQCKYLWTVGQQIIVQFPEYTHFELPDYIFLYQYTHPEAPIRSHKIVLYTAANAETVWLRKGSRMFRIDAAKIEPCERVADDVLYCSYDVYTY